MDAAELGVGATVAEGAAEFRGAVLAVGSALGTPEGDRRVITVHSESNP
jgi:hypothetical protein